MGDLLSPFLQGSNRAAAARLLEILGLIGLKLERGTASAEDDDAVRAEIEASLETLAEAEHDGWMRWHLDQGWRYAPKRDDAQKLHNCLKPYSQLSKTETDKDRATIRRYPDFARRAGTKIVKLRPPSR